VCETLDPRTTQPGMKPVRTENKTLLSRHKAAGLLSMCQRSLDYLIANPTLSVRHRIWSVDSGERSSVVCPRRSPATYCRLNEGEYLPTTFARQDVKSSCNCGVEPPSIRLISLGQSPDKNGRIGIGRSGRRLSPATPRGMRVRTGRFGWIELFPDL
jgi:hypothetical protein